MKSHILFIAIILGSLAAGAPLPAESSITVATDPTYPPMEMLVNGRIVGFDIDLMTEAARAAGLAITFKSVPWDMIFIYLQTGNVDAVVSSVTALEQRRASMDFSIPYYSAEQVILTRPEVSGLASLRDLNGAPVGVVRGTNTAREIADNPQKYAVTLRLYENYDDPYYDLVGNKIDAYIIDRFGAEILLNDKRYADTLRIAGPSEIREDYAIAVRKGNGVLLERINSGLSTVLKSGKAEELESKWIR